ncbi:MAG: hypothetical protein QW234_03315 [Nitrososphaerota archaeon]
MPRRPSSTFRRSYRLRIGYEGEYYLMKKFTGLDTPGYYAVRTPGSGTGKTYKPDLLVVEAGELYALEVKSTNRDSIYVRPDQLERLLKFTELFRVKCPHCGGEFNPKPVLAVRFLGRGWVFQEIGAGGPIQVSLEASGDEISNRDKAKQEKVGEDSYAPRGAESHHCRGHERDRMGDGEGLCKAWSSVGVDREEAGLAEETGLRDKGSRSRSYTTTRGSDQARGGREGGKNGSPKTRRPRHTSMLRRRQARPSNMV